MSIFGCIIASIVLFYLVGNKIRRTELHTEEFPLSMVYPKGYVKQNKVLKFIRRCSKIKTKGEIHWMYYLFHYLQSALLVANVVLLSPLFHISVKKTVFIFGVVEVAICFCLSIIMDIFLIVQMQRCKKIKKTNPEYAKCEFRYSEI